MSTELTVITPAASPAEIDYSQVSWEQLKAFAYASTEIATRSVYQFLETGRYKTEAGYGKAADFIEAVLGIKKRAYYVRLEKYGLIAPIRQVSAPIALTDVDNIAIAPPEAPGPIETTATVVPEGPKGTPVLDAMEAYENALATIQGLTWAVIIDADEDMAMTLFEETEKWLKEAPIDDPQERQEPDPEEELFLPE